MGIFPGFGAWISQNTQQPSKSEKTHEQRDETKEQLKLWRDANKKKQYHEPPPTAKLDTNHYTGISGLTMEFTLGLPPQAAYEVLTNQDKVTYSRLIKGRPLLKAVSRKVIEQKDEYGQVHELEIEVKKELSWNFLFLSGTIPIRLIVTEDPKKLHVRYFKDHHGIKLMDMFDCMYDVEPVYVDAERLCKHMKPKSQKEYRKCSGGKGLIASKVKVYQSFRPTFPWDLPLLSSYVRRFTVETTKKVAEDLQMQASDIREESTVEARFKKLENEISGSLSGSSMISTLVNNTDLLACKAEYYHQCCQYQKCFELTSGLLEKDPFHLKCTLVHLAAAMELGNSNELYLMACNLVKDYPTKALSWFAVGCYYYCIKKYAEGRRYFSKETNIDGSFSPAWIGFGNSFAAQEEGDQAMSAYRTAARLFPGCHLPTLYIGREYMRTHSYKLADQFFMQAKAICPSDPLVYNELGVVAYHMKEYGKAVRWFEKTLGHIPSVSLQCCLHCLWFWSLI